MLDEFAQLGYMGQVESAFSILRGYGIARSLMTPDEIMRLGPKKPLFLPSGGLPYKLERINYLTDEIFQGLYDENPYHRK